MNKEKWYIVAYLENGKLIYSNSEDGMVYTKDEALKEYNDKKGYACIMEYHPDKPNPYGKIIMEHN